MAEQQFPCDRYRPPRLLKGPLLMADLLDIFRCNSISEFRSKIERYKHVGYSRLYDSMRYHKHNRGSVLPSDVEVSVWRALCPQTDRVKQLPLWEVIGDHAPLLIDEQAGVYRSLSTCVTDIVDSRTTQDSWGANDVLFLHERTALAPLVRLCSVDILTLMLMITGDVPVRGGGNASDG